MEILADRKSLPARRTSLIGIFLLTLGIVCDTPIPLQAHEGATGVVKQRMEAMKTIGAAMKRIATMMRGLQDYDATAVAEAARTVEAHGGDAMTALFPEGSAHEPSQARPIIWEDWNRFKALAQDLVRYSRALAEASGNGQGMMGRNRPQGGPMGPGAHHMSQNPDASDEAGQQLAVVPPRMGMPMSDSDALKQMPPQMAFKQLTQTCAACHRDFRVKK